MCRCQLLLLQKPSKFSKLKEHLEALTTQLSLWNEGRVDEILYEDQNIHDRLEAPGNTRSIIKISKKFKFLISKWNVNGALKLSTNSMSNGICPLSNKTLDLLKQEHPEPMESSSETPLQGPYRQIYPVAYDDINESLVMRAAMLKKGESRLLPDEEY